MSHSELVLGVELPITDHREHRILGVAYLALQTALCPDSDWLHFWRLYLDGRLELVLVFHQGAHSADPLLRGRRLDHFDWGARLLPVRESVVVLVVLLLQGLLS